MKNYSLVSILLFAWTISCVPNTPAATQTALITISTPIPVSTPSPISLPNITAEAWANTKANGISTPDEMFPIVGSVNNANKKIIDLVYVNIKLAIILGENINLEDSNNGTRTIISEQLNQQEDLKEQLQEIIKQLPMGERFYAIVVINGEELTNNSSTPSPQAKISQIVITYDNIIVIKRYVFEDGKLRELSKEEEPLLIPPLSVEGSHFIRTDTGEPVMLRGATLMDFGFAPSNIFMENIEGYLSGLKKMGGNAVRISWNAALANDKDYVSSLTETLRLAKESYRLRVMLELGYRGFVDPSDPFSNKRIEIVDEQIVDDWKNLLSNGDLAFWAGRTVDIFNIISEPGNPVTGTTNSVNDPILKEAAQEIRRAIDNEDAIIGFTPGGTSTMRLATDAKELLGKEWNEPESTVTIHPYRLDSPERDRSDIMGYALTLKQQGINLTIGEIGWRDWDMNPEWMERVLLFFEENEISYFVHGLTGGYGFGPLYKGKYHNGELFVDWQGKTLSPPGEYLKELWSQYQDK